MKAEHLPALPSWPEMLRPLLITQFDIAMRVERNVAPSIMTWSIYNVVLKGKIYIYCNIINEMNIGKYLLSDHSVPIILLGARITILEVKWYGHCSPGMYSLC